MGGKEGIRVSKGRTEQGWRRRRRGRTEGGRKEGGRSREAE